MIKIKNLKEFELAKTTDRVVMLCSYCDKEFEKEKRDVNAAIFRRKQENITCSKSCRELVKGNKPPQKVQCKHCGKVFKKAYGAIRVTKNNFCSRQCSNTYNNTNPNINRKCSRSKQETYVEKHIRKTYKELEFLTNDRLTLGGLELDFYFPTLNVAIELNGVYHHRPIMGVKELKSQQHRDRIKMRMCKKLNISLYVVSDEDIMLTTLTTHRQKEKLSKIIDNILTPLLE